MLQDRIGARLRVLTTTASTVPDASFGALEGFSVRRRREWGMFHASGELSVTHTTISCDHVSLAGRSSGHLNAIDHDGGMMF
jgi:hypothetical protein